MKLPQLDNIAIVSCFIQTVITVFVIVHYSSYFSPHFQSIRTINVKVWRSRHILVAAANAQISDSVQCGTKYTLPGEPAAATFRTEE